MRTIKSFPAVIIIAALFPCMLLAANNIPLTAIPNEAAALYAKLIGKVQPNIRPIINEQALKLRQGSIDGHAVSGNLHSSFSAAGIAGMDVSEAAFIIMMMATKDMDEDIKLIMEDIKTITTAKQKLQNLSTRVTQDRDKNARKEDMEVCAPPECGGYQAIMMEAASVLKRVRTRIPIVLREPMNIGQLRSLAADLKKYLDGMNEMSEMASLRLQMTMDRRSKFISTLISMMNKISSSQESIVPKLK